VSAEKPLAGLRVVEVAHYVAVPAAGAMLVDLGAEVVKVEPPRGEVYRRSRPKYAGYDSEFPENPGFHLDNRGKRCLALDLTRPEARDVVLRLVDRADVFLTNLLPARRRKYGLDHETLLARRPSLVVGAINGYGIGGEEADKPAFDYTAYWARTGMMDVMRDEGAPPSLQRPAIGDHAAASNLVCGVLAALRLRDRDGRGRYVETSLLQTGLHVLGADVALALVTRETPHRHDRRRTPNPLWNSYEVAGGRWLLLVMIEPDRYWRPLCEALERLDLRDDPRFADPFERLRNAEALIAELDRTFATRTLDEWARRLERAGVIWAPMQSVGEAILDPQARAMGYVRRAEHWSGPIETMGPPFHIEGVALGTERTASRLNEGAAELLAELGYAPGEIARLLPDEPGAS
jgi:crotonobetainyl-CoA:carnitine CoA-transferase CaiB-like acyl-CoA transferase